MNSDISVGDLLMAMNSRDRDGVGGGGSWLWVIFLFFIFAIFFNGNFFGRDKGDVVTKSDLCEAMNFNQLENTARGTQQGIWDGFYGQGNVLTRGFYEMGAALADNRFSAQECCCETNRNIDSIRAEGYRNTCDITNAIHAEGEATRALINSNTMQELRDRLEARDRELMTANFQLSQQAQSARLINELHPCPKPAYITSSPYYAFPTNGCGCGCGYGNV